MENKNSKEVERIPETRKIVTRYNMKPIPDRRYDWEAHRENWDLGDRIGHGLTEHDAIRDLCEAEELDDLSIEEKAKGNAYLKFLEQLDIWISDCDARAAEAYFIGMEVTEACSLGMKSAYETVRQYLQNMPDSEGEKD